MSNDRIITAVKLMGLIEGSFFRKPTNINKKLSPNKERTSNNCQIERKGIMNFDTKSAAATRPIPINTIIIAKPILSGLVFCVFNYVTSSNSCIEFSLDTLL